MITIGITGAHSDSGKTLLGCELMRNLTGWGAIKCTPTPLYTSITDDMATLATKDKDTGRYIEASAVGVRWVQAPRDEMKEAAQTALDSLSNLPGVLLEGNSAVELLNPNIVIFIFGDKTLFKESSTTVLSMADIIICKKDEIPPSAPEGIKVFEPKDTEGLTAYIAKLLKE